MEEKKEETFKPDEPWMQRRLSTFFATNSVKYDVDGLYVFAWESDKLLETKSGYIYEFEVKISRADFKNDFKHKQAKHLVLMGSEKSGKTHLPCYEQMIEWNKHNPGSIEKRYGNDPRYLVDAQKKPNYFYYAVPEGLISVEDIPEYAGLVYVTQSNIQIIKKAPRLHSVRYSDDELELGEKFYYNMEKWKNAAREAWRDRDTMRKKLMAEIEAKGQAGAYQDKCDECDAFRQAYLESEEKLRKCEESKGHYVREEGRIRRALIREVQKYNPQFNYWEFENELIGK